MLNNEQKNKIKEWARQDTPVETCGLIYVSGESVCISKCKNIASNKNDFFEIDPLHYLRISNNKKNKIIGIFHSQRSGIPTPIDYIVAQGHNCYSIVYSVLDDEFYEMDKAFIKYKEYLYIPFVMGKEDCLGLIIDFYKKEYNIKITNFIRNEQWFEKNPNMISENIEKEGFLKIDKYEDIKEGDIIVFSYRHMGIYIEKDLLLHSPYGRKSTVEKITKEMKRRIDIILHHKERV